MIGTCGLHYFAVHNFDCGADAFRHPDTMKASMVIHLPPEIEAAIAAEAKARGVSVDSIVREALAPFARPLPEEAASGDWDAELESFLDVLPQLPVLPDHALTRENIYTDNGR
jgi:hypothetical protein